MKKTKVVFSLCLLITCLLFIQFRYISKSTIPDYLVVNSGSLFFHHDNQDYFSERESSSYKIDSFLANQTGDTDQYVASMRVVTQKKDSIEDVIEVSQVLGQDTTTMYANTNSNVRSGPGTEYRRIGGVKKNQKVIVTGVADNGWYQVDFGGQVGYICNRLLTEELSVEPVEQVATTVDSASPKTEVVEEQPAQCETKNEAVVVVSNSNTSVIDAILQKTNAERAAYGLSPLMLDQTLAQVAGLRASECASNSCFSHTRPDGSPWYTAMDIYGVNYSYCAENLALSSNPAEDVVALWMGSAGHRENILSANVTKIGIGFAQGSGGYYFVQSFSN